MDTNTTSEERKFRLTADELSQWNENGYFVRLNVFTKEENGCLYVILGSHKYEVHEHKELKGSQQGEFRQAQNVRDEDGVAVEVPAGAIIWFNSQILHKGTDNHSLRFRRANIAHYISAKAEWTRPQAVNKKRPPM